MVSLCRYQPHIDASFDCDSRLAAICSYYVVCFPPVVAFTALADLPQYNLSMMPPYQPQVLTKLFHRLQSAARIWMFYAIFDTFFPKPPARSCICCPFHMQQRHCTTFGFIAEDVLPPAQVEANPPNATVLPQPNDELNRIPHIIYAFRADTVREYRRASRRDAHYIRSTLHQTPAYSIHIMLSNLVEPGKIGVHAEY